MKIRTILLAVIFAVTASTAFAKNSEKSAKKSSQIRATINSVGSEFQTIQPGEIEANLQKLFDEADKFYKAAKAWSVIKCAPKSGFVCTKHECAKRDIKNILILNKKSNAIKRCDGAGYCEEFPATYNQTGVFYNIQSDGPVGTLIRVLGDSRYKEVSTVGLDAYIANGECVSISEEEAEALGKAENPEAAKKDSKE